MPDPLDRRAHPIGQAFDDFGDLSGRQANVKEFHTTKEMYANQKLLMQHGGMSGTWTADQKKMIEEMGMKPE